MSATRRILSLSLVMISLISCGQDESPLSPSDQLSSEASPPSLSTSTRSATESEKADKTSQPLAFQDLAIVFPKDRAQIMALDLIPPTWLEAVNESLARSAIAEYISDENFSEDWSLVSIRVSPCSPLGRVADREEIDRLCWPGVRLVFQPIVDRLSIRGIVRDHYADDRAIHGLYRLDYEDPHLQEVIRALNRGERLIDLEPELLKRFEDRRDQLAKTLIDQVISLRQSDSTYSESRERPEFYDMRLEQHFIEALNRRLLAPYCRVEALHELTAFSLPLGRNPASLELWSFVAFHQKEGDLKQVPISVNSRIDGRELFRFEGEGELMSEDVTATHGDIQLTQALEDLPLSQSEQLRSQVITETTLNDHKIDEINDPYLTLVNQTTCASCHRANQLNFNFHNLSYLEDYEISISPRTFADIERDLAWSEGLERRSKDP